MYIYAYNLIVVIVSPEFIELADAPWKIFPERGTLVETRDAFVLNAARRVLFGGHIDAVHNFASAGCAKIFLDGSCPTRDLCPPDYIVWWNPIAINHTLLDPVL